MVLGLQIPEEAQDLRLDGDVQGGGRLVGDEQPRAAGQRHGDHGPLPHAAAELIGILVHPLRGVGHADAAQHLRGVLPGLRLVHVQVDEHAFGDLVADGVDGAQRAHRLLEDHRDLLAPDLADRAALGRNPRQVDDLVLPVQGDRSPLDASRRARHQTQDGRGGHALAAAALADDADGAVGADVEAHAVDGAHDAVVGVGTRCAGPGLRAASGFRKGLRSWDQVANGSAASRNPSPKKL